MKKFTAAHADVASWHIDSANAQLEQAHSDLVHRRDASARSQVWHAVQRLQAVLKEFDKNG